MADINGIPYVESSDLVSAYPAVSQSLAQEVSDQLASKLATTVTTKGDLISYGTEPARLGIGTNGQVLTADSGETTGMKWADPAGGLTLIHSLSFTSAGGVALDNIFTSDYENYRVLFECRNDSTAAQLRLQMRDGGSSYSGSGYYGCYYGLRVNGSSFTVATTAGVYARIAETNTTYRTVVYMDFYKPNINRNTQFLGASVSEDASSLIHTDIGWTVITTTLYDGIRFSASGGTLSGTVWVYGYQDN